MNVQRSHLVRGSVVFGLSISLFPSRARAESRLEYRAPLGCATEAEFAKAVAARGGHLEPVAAEKASASLKVSILEEKGGFFGTFQVTQSGMASGAREIRSVDCAEVVDALAIVTAIALRPESTAPLPRTPSGAATREAEVAPPIPPRPARPPLKATRTWPVPFSPGDQSVDVNAGTLRFESVTGVTAFAGVAFGVVPGLAMPRLDISLARANFVTLPTDESYLVGPIWRVRASLLGDVTYRSGDLTTDIGGQSVGASTCYSPLFDSGGLELLFCLEVAAGIVGVRTKDASGATTQSKTMGFGTLGLGTETAYNFGRHFQIALRLGLDGAAGPISAERPDGSEIFRSSWLSGYAMLGAGGHW